MLKSIGNQKLSQSDDSENLDLKKVLELLGRELKERDIENVRLKLSKEFELKVRDLERIHFEK